MLSRGPSSGVESESVRLNYKRGKLAGFGLLAVGLGVGGFLLALSPFEGGRGSTRLIIAILGPVGAQIFVAAISMLMAAGGLRFLWLMFGGGLAVQVGARGILVRSVYYTGVLPWASVLAVESGVVAGWGNSSEMLVIHRTDRSGLLLRLVGLGSKVAFQRKLLDADDDALEAWVEAAQNRGKPVHAGNAAHPIAMPQRVFGRRQ